jgi:putative tryptophan/tyrosine transport system substrate-binding protein
MRRRDFILLAGGTVIAWPLYARAQQAAPIVGFLDTGAQTTNASLVAAFRDGLRESGFLEGENVRIEYRWANGDYGRLPELAAELVRIPVAVLATGGGEPTARAAKAATTSIPIVFDSGTSPVELGLVGSLNHPGGNMTGVNQMVEEVVTKQIGLLHVLVPQARVIGMLVDPNLPRTEGLVRHAQATVGTFGCELRVVNVGSDEDFDAAFATLKQERIGALLISATPFFSSRRNRIIALAASHAIPALYVRREFASDGGLMSYGTSLPDAYHQIGVYVGRILKGEKPTDLPIVQPTKFDLAINLKTAKALGLTVPPSLLATADEVIE